jgi:GTP1/Obg family GTP-binding protein
MLTDDQQKMTSEQLYREYTFALTRAEEAESMARSAREAAGRLYAASHYKALEERAERQGRNALAELTSASVRAGGE